MSSSPNTYSINTGPECIYLFNFFLALLHRGKVHVPQSLWGGQKTIFQSQFSASTTWVLGNQWLGSKCFYTEPSCQPGTKSEVGRITVSWLSLEPGMEWVLSGFVFGRWTNGVCVVMVCVSWVLMDCTSVTWVFPILVRNRRVCSKEAPCATFSMDSF